MRNASGQMGGADHRVHFCHHDDRRGRACDLCADLRAPAQGLLDNGLCRMHVLRPWQRDRRRGCDPVDSQVVQGREYGFRHGTTASDRQIGNRIRPGGVSETGRREGRRADIFIDRDGPSGIPRTGADACRDGSVGGVCGNGRQIRQTCWI